MYSECPFCHTRIEGTPINKREASILRTAYKTYYSLLVPIPFIGAYIGGKIYDIISSADEWYYRFMCPQCCCSWVSTNNNCEIKIGGNKHLATFFYRGSFVIGSIENECYMIQTEENGRTKATVVSNAGTLLMTKYENGYSQDSQISFGEKITSQGMYIGELNDNQPNGWGACFLKNGYIWYGKWLCGKRNGIGYECDFDGSDFKAGYWIQNIKTI